MPDQNHASAGTKPGTQMLDLAAALSGGTPDYGVVSYGRALTDAYLSAVQQAVRVAGGRIMALENAAGNGYAVTKLMVEYDGGIQALRLAVTAAASALGEDAQELPAPSSLLPCWNRGGSCWSWMWIPP
ncbi:hypothetical protein [Arthrobacter sp. ATA002]|uniref:hypothetical protein n=1 Tax=Arthrobacter sp. ATA002 TaxID=2991715 RepID=UPI002E36E7EE|nr:hypothetical protein [Arthrobacter sp. ATA002]